MKMAELFTQQVCSQMKIIQRHMSQLYMHLICKYGVLYTTICWVAAYVKLEVQWFRIKSQGYKKFFLNLAEHEVLPAHKC